MKNLLSLQPPKTQLRDRLTDVRAIYEGDADNLDRKILLAGGGCFMPTPIPVLKRMMDGAFNLKDMPHQVYPEQNASPAFCDAIWNYFSQHCGIPLNDNDGIVYGYGSSHLFDVYLSVICRPGDLILMPESYYHAYVEWPQKWGGEAICVPTKAENGYKLTANDLAAWFKHNPDQASKARCLVLTSPNSCGSIYAENELKDIARIVNAHGLLVFSDEVYRDAVYPGQKAIATASIPELKNVTVTANSGSKTKSVANLRIGWACGPKSIVDQMIWHLEYSMIDVPLSLQNVGTGILTEVDDTFLQEAATEYQTRMNLILQLMEYSNIRLNAFFGTSQVAYLKTPYIPQSGYSICIDFNEFTGWHDKLGHVMMQGRDLCHYLAHHAHIAEDGSSLPHGVILSSGFTKGHDNFEMYMVFGQAGFELANAQHQNQMGHEMLGHMIKNWVRPDVTEAQMNAVFSALGLEEQPKDTGFEQARLAGRQSLIEAFDRIVCALKELQPA